MNDLAFDFPVHRRIDADGDITTPEGDPPGELDSPRRLPILTVSAARMYRRCAREYFHRVEQGLVAATERATALRFGSLIHLGLEAWWGPDTRGDERLEAALTQVRAQPDVDPFDLARAEIMLRGYHGRWCAERLEPVAVEAEFNTELRNPLSGRSSLRWRLAGKLDAVAVDKHGRHWIVEHKTTSEDVSLGSQYWARLKLDAQVSTYFAGARSLGYEPVGCIYDVLAKPRQRPFTATPVESRRYTRAGTLYKGQRDQDESLDEYRMRVEEAVNAKPHRYYARGDVVRLDFEELDAARDTWMLAKVIQQSKLSKRWPRNPDACSRYGRMCQFWGLCTKTAADGDYVKERPHAELQEVA